MRIENLDSCAVVKWRLTDVCNYKCPYCIRKPLAQPYDEDEKKCIEAIPHIRRLARELHKNTGKQVKVDLIGGEVTVFKQLGTIVNGLLEEECIEKVNITSNFSDNSLFDIASPKLTLTLSYHPTQTAELLADFIERAKELKPKVRFLKCETVATYEATHIDEFIKLCNEAGLEWQVEENLTDERCKGKGCRSKKPSPRYRVTDDNGEVREFGTRNEFLKKHGIKGVLVNVVGHLCSRDFDYLYIEQDKVQYCFGSQPVAVAQVAHGLHPCHREQGKQQCTLCGNISIYPAPRAVFKFGKEVAGA